MSLVAIVIVSFNVRDDLARCLESLADTPPSVSHDIVVVDNASSDGSAAMVRERFPRVRVIEAAANAGFSRANNLGIRSTDSEFVLLLNSDTMVPAGAVDRLIAYMRAHDEVAAIGPRIVDAQGAAELSFGRMVGPFTELARKSALSLQDRGFRPVQRQIERLTRRVREVDWVTGACLLVRRGEALSAGLLDERFFLYYEDVDFCAALRARGGRVHFAPVAEIVHVRGRSRASSPVAAEHMRRRSHLAFYDKHHRHFVRWLRAYLWVRGSLPE